MSNTVYDVYLREMYNLNRVYIRWNELIIHEANNDFCNVNNSVCTMFMSVNNSVCTMFMSVNNSVYTMFMSVNNSVCTMFMSVKCII